LEGVLTICSHKYVASPIDQCAVWETLELAVFEKSNQRHSLHLKKRRNYLFKKENKLKVRNSSKIGRILEFIMMVCNFLIDCKIIVSNI